MSPNICTMLATWVVRLMKSNKAEFIGKDGDAWRNLPFVLPLQFLEIKIWNYSLKVTYGRKRHLLPLIK